MSDVDQSRADADGNFLRCLGGQVDADGGIQEIDEGFRDVVFSQHFHDLNQSPLAAHEACIGQWSRGQVLDGLDVMLVAASNQSDVDLPMR